MTLRLPTALSTSDDALAITLLRRYYGRTPAGGRAYTGSAWDTWDSTGTRSNDPDRFTADDLISVALLGVDIPGNAVLALLDDDADRLADLLAAVGPDRDLSAETAPIRDDWPGSVLYRAVDEITGLGRTKVSKLLARKRPRLFPIRDSVVERVTGAGFLFWEPLRQVLRQDNLHDRLRRYPRSVHHRPAPKSRKGLRTLMILSGVTLYLAVVWMLLGLEGERAQWACDERFLGGDELQSSHVQAEAPQLWPPRVRCVVTHKGGEPRDEFISLLDL